MNGNRVKTMKTNGPFTHPPLDTPNQGIHLPGLAIASYGIFTGGVAKNRLSLNVCCEL
jgi:hypothetical protein